VPQQVDYRLIGSAIARVNWELNVTCGHERNPGFYVDQTLGLLFLSVAQAAAIYRSAQPQLSKPSELQPTVSERRENLAGKAIRPFALAAIEKLVDVRPADESWRTELGPLLSGVSAAELQRIDEDAIAALESLHDWLNTNLTEMKEQTAVGREAYVYFLKNVALMPFTPEQLLVMGAHEWERSVAFETFEQTRNQGVPELDCFPIRRRRWRRKNWEGAARRFSKRRTFSPCLPG
jgi:hypothetical protein